jgi:hypothetical protein
VGKIAERVSSRGEVQRTGPDGWIGPSTRERRRQERIEAVVDRQMSWQHRPSPVMFGECNSNAIDGGGRAGTRRRRGRTPELEPGARRRAVGRELFLFPWPSVALALWEKEWGVRKALPTRGQGALAVNRGATSRWRVPLPFRASDHPCRPSCPGPAAAGQPEQAQQKPRHGS